MRCYQHREAEAVGICRFCARGLCPECAVLVGRALACKGVCEREVGLVVGALAQRRALTGWVVAGFCAGTGVLLLAWFALGGGAVALGAALVFLIVGTVSALVTRKHQ